MAKQKISLDIDAEIYTRLKQDVFVRRTTMAKAIRELLEQRWGDEDAGKQNVA